MSPVSRRVVRWLGVVSCGIGCAPAPCPLFRDLQAAVRADLGGDVDDDALLFEIARRALGGPGDEGRAGY